MFFLSVHNKWEKRALSTNRNTQRKINYSNKISLMHMSEKERERAQECLGDSTKHMYHSLPIKKSVLKDTKQRKRMKKHPYIG